MKNRQRRDRLNAVRQKSTQQSQGVSGMKSQVTFIVSAVLFLGGYQSVLAQSPDSDSGPYSVNCEEGASINSALESGYRSIVFSGVCDEDVVAEGFKRVEIVGVDRVRRNNQITSLTIQGPTLAILENFESGDIELTHDITAAASNIAVVGGELGVRFGSNALLSGIDVTGALRIEHNSFAALKGSRGSISSIESDEDQSVQVLQNSSAWILDGTLIINHSDEDAVIVASGSKGLIDGDGSIISGGVTISGASSFNVRNGRVASAGSSRAFAVASRSKLTVRPNVELIGYVELSGDSTLVNEVGSPIAVVADVACEAASANSEGCSDFN